MADTSLDPAPDRRGFSSRWILDGSTRRTVGAVPGNARASASPVDTDGDGIADTLALRVDGGTRRSPLRSVGTWLGRSFVTIVVVAALVIGAVAATTALEARGQLDVAEAGLAEARAELADVRGDLDASRLREVDAREEAATASVQAERLAAEQEELELEVRVLRRMLLDSERRADVG